MAPVYAPEILDRLRHVLEEVRAHAVAQARSRAEDVGYIDPEHRASALNLLHYLGFRQHDLRDAQTELARLGLSSLGRNEAHVLAGLDATIAALSRLAGRDAVALAPAATSAGATSAASAPAAAASSSSSSASSCAAASSAAAAAAASAPSAPAAPPLDAPPVDHASGPAMLAEHADALLGPTPAGRSVRVMVTMPSEAATNAALVRSLVEAGMDIMRVNCAHDGPAAWERMIANLKKATTELGRPCRVLMDLAGPKLRTGAIEGGAAVVRVKPRKGPRGETIAPARVLLVPSPRPGAPGAASAALPADGALGARDGESGDGGENGDAPPEDGPDPAEVDAVIPVDGAVLATARVGDVLRLEDCRERGRGLHIVAGTRRGLIAESRKSAYIEAGADVTLERRDDVVARGRVGVTPRVDEPLLLSAGDILRLTAAPVPGGPARRDKEDRVVEPAHIACTLPEILREVRPGDRIWFDDGKIVGVVERAAGDALDVKVTHVPRGGAALRSDRGINLPDTPSRLPALSAKDLSDLGFAAAHADMVALSFVRGPEDVAALVRELDARGVPHLGILLKIETRSGFERLPSILLEALRSPPVGVMVARGDLAVECGFDRLAEVQEEILWLCEAAHIPVVWATQVLETLAKTGVPSRAEVTDAAMSGRAECVMLNKGPHIVDALRFLDNVLKRMQDHQRKKRAMLRRLAVSRLGAAAEGRQAGAAAGVAAATGARAS